jgi:SAM-dependent methyltransferase
MYDLNHKGSLQLVVIISTTRKEKLINISLPSIFNQTRKPDIIYVVADTEENLPHGFEIKQNAKNIPLKYMLNSRERNLSGAINTVLAEMLVDGFDPDMTFIALLDDDDWWEQDYLGSCLDAALANGSDWVVSGIIRHESINGPEVLLSIPDKLNIRLFLRGNPHIQGSNLFLKFSKMLLAGGYDENLPSTTDRDICLRLLLLGDAKITVLNRHMVHHLAFGRERLSEPGSEKKCLGLERFYNKYRFFMDKDDREAFLRRSKEYFGCNPEVPLQGQNVECTSEKFPEPPDAKPNIVIGAIVSDKNNFENLIKGAISLKKGTGSVSALVISDNAGLSEFVTKGSHQLASEGIDLVVISQEEADASADMGDLGQYYSEKNNRRGIAFGRTVLHRHVYLKCLDYPDPVAWIIDDDISLSNIYWGTFQREVNGNDILGLIGQWKKAGISIVVGKIGGDPPVPVMSTTRTQMLDIFFNIKAQLLGYSHSCFESGQRAIKNTGNDFPGYFYDFPEESFRHLESPVWKHLSVANNEKSGLSELSRDAGLLLTKSVFRPAVYPDNSEDCNYNNDTEKFGPVRGGNTIILDIERLRDFNNSSPRNGETGYRRGDTLWVILNKRLGPSRRIRNPGNIISSPLMVAQSRAIEEPFCKMREKLFSDTLGSAFARSLDRLLLEKNRNGKTYLDYYGPLDFSEYDIEKIMHYMDLEIGKRARLILLNSWRILGLAKSIRSALNEFKSNFPEMALSEKNNLDGIENVCSKAEILFGRQEIESLVKKAMDFNREEVSNFLHQLSPSCRQFRDALPIYYSGRDITEIKKIIRDEFKCGQLTDAGMGREGIIFSDGVYSYKYFHYGRFGLDIESIDFLKKALLNKKFKSIASLEDIRFVDGHLILKAEYVHGNTYNGGKIQEIISMLKECKFSGIVIKNLAPKNLIANEVELKFVDIGRDIVPYTEKGYMLMCRRAYLTYRWHFRNDINELFHRSNLDGDFPELFGFNYFMDMLQYRNTEEISVPFVEGALSSTDCKRILDYGCGNGHISDDMAEFHNVYVYDKDMSAFYRKHKNNIKVTILDREGLDIISLGQNKFDSILLSLVLCTVDDAEAREILIDARRLIRTGSDFIVVICNPFNVNNIETSTHVKIGNIGDYHKHFTFEKKMKATGNLRREYHRPLDWYIDEMKKAGFKASEFSESTGASFQDISPGSEFIMIRAMAIEIPEEYDVSLMIKASAMDWRSIGFQARHIVKQLEGPEKFKEKFIVTDSNETKFARQYGTADVASFKHEMQCLIDDGIIDKVVYASENDADLLEVSKRWFGIGSKEMRSLNGQPVLTTLQGFEHADSKYILQMDSDCIISRDGKKTSYLTEMVGIMDRDEKAVTISFPICNKSSLPYTSQINGKKWRTEVRNSLIQRPRLLSLLPLPNSTGNDGKLVFPWHRSLDIKLASSQWESYRGSSGNAFFTHVPNSLKPDINFWYNAVKNYENLLIPDKQMGNVNLQAKNLQELLDRRNEEMVILVKGRNVSIPKLRRCLYSLKNQDFHGFGVIYIDAASRNGSDQYIEYMARNMFPGRFTFFRNYVPLTSMENIFIAINSICRNPESIIVMVDADDALISTNALSRVWMRYQNGADLTVGTMIRTDKYKEYPVNFKNPRFNRGGNVWQHLRTFRKYLFDSISKEDLMINGKWIEKAEDWAYMVPMVEMANHPEVIHDILYFYEPSPEKKLEDKIAYEGTIGKIISKRPYKKVVQ